MEGAVLKAKIVKGEYEAKLEFLEGFFFFFFGGGGSNEKAMCGSVMNISWNNATITNIIL